LMIVLGFSGGFKRAEEDDFWIGLRHDSSAAIIRDGEIVAAVEEERLNRLKHTNCFPSRAIHFCLSKAQATWDDVDLIVTGAEAVGLTAAGQADALLDATLTVPADADEFIASLFQRDFGIDPRPKLRFCSHHEAHIWSAYSFSGFDEALILSIDGAGDSRSGSAAIGSAGKLIRLTDFPVAQSLGHFYLRTIRLMGFSYFDEYKAMGLAPYGNPDVFKEVFDASYDLLPEGRYKIDSAAEWTNRFRAAGLVTKARRKGQPFSQLHMDLAAGLQAALETIVLHVLDHYRELTGIKNLCLAGGVAHNCTLNGKILKSGLFERTFVQPASHDAGLAVGACCALFSGQSPAVPVQRMKDVFLGPDCAEDEMLREISRWREFVEIVDEDQDFTTASKLLADGAVIGRVFGRSEFGPRALGNRSILADPRPASHKDLINQMVKKREQFRPFAPAVMQERANEIFEIPACEADLSYMTYTVSVKPAWRSQLGAVVHCDGTARIQTVCQEVNPTFWSLLDKFAQLTGVPVLLNTSFNNNAEPIVNTAEDAMVCYLTTGLDYLLLGRYVVRKRAATISLTAFSTLRPDVPSTRRLVAQRDGCHCKYFVESVKANMDRRPKQEISETVYRMLGSGTDSNVGVLLDKVGVCAKEERINAVAELNELWSSRLIGLQPSR
jgi:carbamoyltransferase